MEVSNGLVSVIVPVYNASKYIDQTINSVVNQTYNNWELILVDDGSTDNSIDIIKIYSENEKIKLLQHPGGINLGVSRSRELGVKAAKGDFIAFLDADDCFNPNKLIEQLSIFSEKEDVVLVHSKVELLNNSDIIFKNEFILEEQNIIYHLHKRKTWLKKNEICNSTVLVKSKVLHELQFGLPQLFQYEDWLLWSLIAEKGKFYFQNKAQIKYRMHPDSATAKVLINSLVSPYSKIEYLISLYILAKSDNIKVESVKQLKKTFIRLFEIYSKHNPEKTRHFKSDFYNIEIDKELLLNENKNLNDEISILEKEVNELKKIKNSRSYRLIELIRRKIKLI